MNEKKASKEAKNKIKPDYSLIPRCFMDQVSYAMMAGEKKYGRFNYVNGHNLSELTAAMTRHIKQFESGEDFDKDCSDLTGKQVSHLACVASNCLMLLHQIELKTLTDDRLVNNGELLREKTSFSEIFLVEFLRPNKVTHRELIEKAGLDLKTAVHLSVGAKIKLTDDIVAKLSRYFQVTPEFIWNLYNNN